MFRGMSTSSVLFKRETRRALFLGFATFMLIGVSNTLYGPAFAQFSERYGVGIDSVGLLVSAQFGGALLAMLVSIWSLKRLGYRRQLVMGGVLTIIGALLVTQAPSWGLALAAAAIGGFGTGGLVVSVNLFAARVFQSAASPALNLMNAVFGLGAISGPLLVAVTFPRLEVPFLILAALAAGVVVMAAGVDAPAVRSPALGAARVPIAPLLGFAFVMFFYVATEVGISSWETEHLSDHFGTVRAAAFTSLFWIAITVGRLLAVPLSSRIHPGRLVTFSLGLSVVGLIIAQVPALAPLGYALAGLFLAPVFATNTAWFTQSLGERAERYAPLAFAIGNLGPVSTSPLIGLAAWTYGTGAIPTLLAVTAVCGTCVAAGLLATHGRWSSATE